MNPLGFPVLSVFVQASEKARNYTNIGEREATGREKRSDSCRDSCSAEMRPAAAELQGLRTRGYHTYHTTDRLLVGSLVDNVLENSIPTLSEATTSNKTTIMSIVSSGQALCVHGALLWAATCWSGFLMMAEGPNPKLLLVAHQKGFLHAFSLFGFGAAMYMGCFPKTTPSKANISFWLLAGGAWVSLIGDTAAAFLNEALPLGAEKTGATSNPDGANATILKLSAMAMGVGSVMLCAGVDAAGLLGKAKTK